MLMTLFDNNGGKKILQSRKNSPAKKETIQKKKSQVKKCNKRDGNEVIGPDKYYCTRMGCSCGRY